MSEPVDDSQGSEAWKRQRLAKITGTRAHAVIVGGKGYEVVFNEVLEEFKTGELPPDIDNEFMKHGRDTEPVAADHYAANEGVELEELKFITHPADDLKDWVGASPDRKVKDQNMYIEIKCPGTENHRKFCKTGNIPVRYQSQMLLQMAVSPEIESVDFVSFDDRKENYEGIEYYVDMIISNFPRDAKRIKDMETKIRKFIYEVKSAI